MMIGDEALTMDKHFFTQVLSVRNANYAVASGSTPDHRHAILSTYCQPKCTQQCEHTCDLNRAQQQTPPIAQQPTLNCAYECQPGCQQYSSCNTQQQKSQPKVIHIVMDPSVAKSTECVPQCVHLCNEQCSTSLPIEKCQLACETSCEDSCTQLKPALTTCQQLRGMQCDCEDGYAQCGYLPICCRR
uniref:Uncharacterized protein n=1 Tax=Parascaris equorum TaxID=6256 RepID=A0A914SBR0_PAREQ